MRFLIGRVAGVRCNATMDRIDRGVEHCHAHHKDQGVFSVRPVSLTDRL